MRKCIKWTSCGNFPYICSMKDEAIHIDNLAIGYSVKGKEKIVANHISAVIKSGELTCLLGANGVGKSTLLRTLSSFQPKMGGAIYIAGKEIKKYNDRQLSKVVSVVLTEKCDLYNMTVAELVGLGRTPYTGFWGGLSVGDEKVVRQAMEQVGIAHLSQRMAHTLSDGERQKAMIAKALAQETPVIFLDEPTAFLDFPSKVEMLLLLHHLSREMHKTIFLSTHDLELALQIADKIWLMDAVKGVHIGTPEDLALNGELEQFFSGKNVAFEPGTGFFRVSHASMYQVGLSGNDAHRCAMVKKALSRVGIEAVPAYGQPVTVEVGDEYYTICHSRMRKGHLSTIEELLDVFDSNSVPLDCHL